MPATYAYRAVVSLEAEGEGERAYFWFLLLVMLGDIASHRLNPDGRSRFISFPHLPPRWAWRSGSRLRAWRAR